MRPRVPRFVVWAYTRLHRWFYRVTRGRIVPRLSGLPFMLLTTIGRKSGLERSVPLMYLEDGGRYVVVASNVGSDNHPAWYLNLQSNPRATVEIRGVQQPVVMEEASEEERERLYPQFAEKYASYGHYLEMTKRHIPVVMLRPE